MKITSNKNPKENIESKITTVCPKNFDEDTQIIADYLRDNIPVIINLEETAPEQAKRILDFSLGTTYAIDGAVQQISDLVFICTPKNVTVTFNREEATQNEHTDFSWFNKRS